MRNLLIPFIFLYGFPIFGQEWDYDRVLNLEGKVPNTHNSEWATQQPYVVLISIDGFRYDYAEKYEASNIQKLATEGLSSERLIPSFPSKTFPNHYTIVTGCYPGKHGILTHEYYSRSKDQWFRVQNRTDVEDGTWYGSKPLWVLAEQQEMLTASFFWVGAAADIQDIKPTYHYSYNERIPNTYRVRRIIDWLKLPEAKRPHFITGYFSLVDNAGHRYGPDHRKTGEAVQKVDSLIGDLMQGLKTLNLPIYMILVSDHGMSPINRGLVLPEIVDLEDSKVAYSYPTMIYQDDSAKLERIYSKLCEVPLIDVYKREDVPGYLHFQNTDRVGDIVIFTKPPLVILEKPERVYGGNHGYDPYVVKDMSGIFYATGPGIKEGLRLPPFENIHIFPFIADILGLKYDQEQIDGSRDAIMQLLNNQ